MTRMSLMSELESLRRTIGAVTHLKDLFHNWLIDCHYRCPTFVFVNLENGNGQEQPQQYELCGTAGLAGAC